MNKRPSLRDIAAATNVSVTTVSLVLNDRPGISERTRDRVLEVAAQLGYEATAPSVAKPSCAVGLLIEQGSMHALLDIFYGDIVRGFQAEAQRLGYRVVLQMYDQHTDRLDEIQSDLAAHVQGLVVANDGNITPQMVIQLDMLDIPMVLIENRIEGRHLPSVLGDNFVAGYTVMHHLLKLGHQEVAILRGPTKYSSLVDRLLGCFAALGEAGLTIPDFFLPGTESDHPQKGYIQMKRILALPQRPTAVLAISDKTALGAMSAIREAGLLIPTDIAIASIDNVAGSAHTHPPLTTYHIPKREMGVLAMQTLYRIIQGEPEIAAKSVVYGELIVRDSCGAYRPVITTNR